MFSFKKSKRTVSFFYQMPTRNKALTRVHRTPLNSDSISDVVSRME